MAGTMRTFVLDTNCFTDASRTDAAADALAIFSARVAPRLYLSSVVAAELAAGVRSARERRSLNRLVLAPYSRRRRIVNPSATAWQTLGTILARLVEKDGLVLRDVRRGFAFDVLIAASCREIGAVLVSANTADLSRIARVFPFDFVAPYPDDE
jgi:predicted nucleic acid-binding protein